MSRKSRTRERRREGNKVVRVSGKEEGTKALRIGRIERNGRNVKGNEARGRD